MAARTNKKRKQQPDTDVLRAALRPKGKERVPTKDLLSSGVTLVNLAFSGRTAGAFAKRRYYLIVGDSEAGKTFLILTIMAMIVNNPEFDKHEIIYDNVEDGALMDWAHYFGRKAVKRIKAPGYDAKGNPTYSETVEEFYYMAEDAAKRGPCIVFLDSENALESMAERKKHGKQKRAAQAGESSAGDYGVAKAKYHSAHLRGLKNRLKKHDSMLFIVSQSRQNLKMMSHTKTRAGGDAIKFYADGEMWLSVKETLYKSVGKQNLQNGIVTRIDIRKNRGQGKKRTVLVPILHDYGIDDIGASIDWLCQWGSWTSSSKAKFKSSPNPTIKAPDFDFVGSRNKLIKHIENNELERELRSVVATEWRAIEAKLAVDRKPRFA